jgi:hypothetical protein
MNYASKMRFVQSKNEIKGLYLANELKYRFQWLKSIYKGVNFIKFCLLNIQLVFLIDLIWLHEHTVIPAASLY